MPKQKKLSLKDLKVESFVTSVEEAKDGVKGGGPDTWGTCYLTCKDTIVCTNRDCVTEGKLLSRCWTCMEWCNKE